MSVFDDFDPFSAPTDKNAYRHPVPNRPVTGGKETTWEFTPAPPGHAKGRLSFSGMASLPTASTRDNQTESNESNATTGRRRGADRTGESGKHKKTLSNTLNFASLALNKNSNAKPTTTTYTTTTSTKPTASTTNNSNGSAAAPTKRPLTTQVDSDEDEEEEEEESEEEEEEEDSDEEPPKKPATKSTNNVSSKASAGANRRASNIVSQKCAVAGCDQKRTTRGYCATHAADPKSPVNKTKSIKDADQWSMALVKGATSLGMMKNCLEWIIVDKELQHKIELFHSVIGGKRIIKINGVTKLNEKRPMDNGSRYDIRIGPKGQTAIGIEVRPSGIVGFTYELFVNGRCYDDARLHWLKHADA